MICYVIRQQRHKIIKIAQHVIQPETALDKLILWVNQIIGSNKAQMVCRIILLNDIALQQNLPLPQIELMPFELNDYVSSTLTKIFHTEDLLAYDYCSTSPAHSMTQNSQISVYALPKHLLEQYLTQLGSWRINYIGIPERILSIGSNSLSTNDMQQLACSVHLNGINFLPWREWEKTKRQNRIFIFIFVMLLVLIMIMLWLTDLTNQNLNQQINKNTLLHQQYLQKKAQLSLLKDLHTKNEQMQLIIHQYELFHLEHFNIVKYLISISETIPEGIWLNSLEYKDNGMLLAGQAHIYADVILFCQQLAQHQWIQNSQITAIKHSASGLFFYIQLQFMQKSPSGNPFYDE